VVAPFGVCRNGQVEWWAIGCVLFFPASAFSLGNAKEREVRLEEDSDEMSPLLGR
jgi:hypothetical protein